MLAKDVLAYVFNLAIEHSLSDLSPALTSFVLLFEAKVNYKLWLFKSFKLLLKRVYAKNVLRYNSDMHANMQKMRTIKMMNNVTKT